MNLKYILTLSTLLTCAFTYTTNSDSITDNEKITFNKKIQITSQLPAHKSSKAVDESQSNKSFIVGIAKVFGVVLVLSVLGTALSLSSTDVPPAGPYQNFTPITPMTSTYTPPVTYYTPPIYTPIRF